MKRVKELLFGLVMIAGLSLAISAQRDDQKKPPPKDPPPKVEVPREKPPPRQTPTPNPKKPGGYATVWIGKDDFTV